MLREGLLRGRSARVFTLQWHLTNACSNHCRHCYDRSDRGEPSLEEALRILGLFREFCRRRHVLGRISLTGGDPLLYTRFDELYAAIAKARIPVSILGNPVSRETIRELVAVRRPIYYQVSLEGLRDHNDEIRGRGHFDNTMRFLADAREEKLTTHVMLTLTRANLDQVIPLGRLLAGRTRKFTFNRLAAVGEGASLALPDRECYEQFLRDYLEAAKENPVLGFKDNLFNILRDRLRRPYLGGCTGSGCGAAFNFVALLPDGEVHACRKFPSLIGNITYASLAKVYESPKARRYRSGPGACRACRLRKVCRGCPAVIYGAGMDPLQDLDPHCFIAR
jgi:selenobiotic family peptide radical SAM maturase